MFRIAAAVLALSLVNAPVGAQHLETLAYVAPSAERAEQRPTFPALIADKAQAKPVTRDMVAGGVIAGAVGLVGGGMIGYGLKSCGTDDWFCGMGEAMIGSLIGEAVMLPYGVHLSSGRSSYAGKALLSLLAVGMGTLAAPITGGMSLLAVPPLQLALTIASEHAAARRNAQSSQENDR